MHWTDFPINEGFRPLCQACDKELTDAENRDYANLCAFCVTEYRNQSQAFVDHLIAKLRNKDK